MDCRSIHYFKTSRGLIMVEGHFNEPAAQYENTLDLKGNHCEIRRSFVAQAPFSCELWGLFFLLSEDISLFHLEKDKILFFWGILRVPIRMRRLGNITWHPYSCVTFGWDVHEMMFSDQFWLNYSYYFPSGEFRARNLNPHRTGPEAFFFCLPRYCVHFKMSSK